MPSASGECRAANVLDVMQLLPGDPLLAGARERSLSAVAEGCFI